ncbi:hypothetical protein CP02DC14_1921B, partial [Chlamydia psittaci 02DC14]
LRGKL